jgi:hypothetical protein
MRKKNNSRWKYTNEIILFVFPVVIHRRNYYVVSVAYAVNILQLSVKYRRNMSVSINVGDSGICSEYFSTIYKIPTDYVHLEIRRL